MGLFLLVTKTSIIRKLSVTKKCFSLKMIPVWMSLRRQTPLTTSKAMRWGLCLLTGNRWASKSRNRQPWQLLHRLFRIMACLLQLNKVNNWQLSLQRRDNYNLFHASRHSVRTSVWTRHRHHALRRLMVSLREFPKIILGLVRAVARSLTVIPPRMNRANKWSVTWQQKSA